MAKDRLRRGRALPRATLGKRRPTPFTYSPQLLEAVPLSIGRAFAAPGLWVSLRCLRFTSLCPVTGQPDWATLTISYIPAGLLVESKSLKEYLQSFRNHGDFHEDVCRIICDDLVRLLRPRYLEVVGRFDARGSIAIWPFVQYAAPDDAEMQALRQARATAYAPGRYDCFPASDATP
ncbi:MAG: preQ(1) synthase [Planctomycetota bacterium]|nr:preQ(1) synthase [Planctomycetota bacterium]MCX8039464.1 preQ(1) synthase [Planctomycetota bacterium]MDW8373582.1 preQ(1) synthase [Planctomycetota bacterium]